MFNTLLVIGAKVKSNNRITGDGCMTDRITLSVSDSSSDSEIGESDTNKGGDTTLGAVDQDKDWDSKSGNANRISRGSLSAPKRVGSMMLGARPKERTEIKHPGKGVEWVKRDRRSAKLHKGKGQKIAADRAAKAAAKGGGGATTSRTTIAVRVVGTGPRGRRGPGSDQLHRKKSSTDSSAAGVCEVATVISICTSIVAVSAYDLLTLENSNTALGAVTGLGRAYLGKLTAGFFVVLLMLFAMLVSALSHRNRKTT